MHLAGSKTNGEVMPDTTTVIMNDEIVYLAFNWISADQAVDIVLICLLIVTPICMMAIGFRSSLSQKKGAFDKFIIWLMLTVAVALTPIITNTIYLFMTGETPTFTNILAGGELLIISVAIAADAAGRILCVLGDSAPYKSAKIFLATLCIWFIIISSTLYPLSSISPSSSLQEQRVANISLIVFLSTAIISACCVFISEKQ